MKKGMWRSSFHPVAVLVALLSLYTAGCSGDDNDDDFEQFDRMGFPVVNTAVVPTESKDTFNLGDPSTDTEEFLDIVRARIEAIRAAVNAVPGFPPEDSPGISSDALARTLLPDVLTIDLSAPIAFPNGRRLTDDVIDGPVGLVLNRGNVLGGGPGVSDGIANDSVLRPTFPYLGEPN